MFTGPGRLSDAPPKDENVRRSLTLGPREVAIEIEKTHSGRSPAGNRARIFRERESHPFPVAGPPAAPRRGLARSRESPRHPYSGAHIAIR